MFKPVQILPKGSPIPHMKAPANPMSQGTSPITGLVYAAICGTKKYLSSFSSSPCAGKEVPNVVMVLLQFWVFGSLYQRRCGVTSCVLSRQPHFFFLVAAATSASCRGTSQQNIAFQTFLHLQTLRRLLSRPVAAGVSLSLKDVAASQYVCSRGADNLSSISLRFLPWE